MNLPSQEAFISSCELVDSNLLVRLVTDYHPGADPAAYLIKIEEPIDPDKAIGFFLRCSAKNQCVYVFEKDGHLVFETEFGEELALQARHIFSAPSDFNEKELAEVLNRVYQWYLSENSALRSARGQIHEAQNLLTEAARRVEIKAASHKADSTAAVLYSQQLTLIQRVLHALGT